MQLKSLFAGVLLAAASVMVAPDAKAVEIDDTVISCTETTCLVWRCITIGSSTDCSTGLYPRSWYPEWNKEP